CGSAGRSTSAPLACGDDVPPSGTAFPAEIREDPFALGIASGDPRPDAVLLWTRLALRSAPLEPLPPVDVPVEWEIARDAGFRSVVAAGRAWARAAYGHSVRVDVAGLEPATMHWYRFAAGPFASPVGRTRTAPDPRSSPDA